MLFLIPAYLSEESPIDYFAPSIKEYILKTDYFFVENEKTARKVIKFFAPEKKQSDLKLFLLDKYSESNDLKEALKHSKEKEKAYKERISELEKLLNPPEETIQSTNSALSKVLETLGIKIIVIEQK